jgi:hypothetical protein
MKLFPFTTRRQLKARIAELEGEAGGWNLMVSIEAFNAQLARGEAVATIAVAQGTVLTQTTSFGQYGSMSDSKHTVEADAELAVERASRQVYHLDDGRLAVDVTLRVDERTTWTLPVALNDLAAAKQAAPTPEFEAPILMSGAGLIAY